MKPAFIAFIAIAFSPVVSAETLARRSLVEIGQSIPYQGGTREVEEFGGYFVTTNGDTYFSATVTLGGAGVWRINADGIVEVLTRGTPIADNPNETWNGYFPSLAANASGELVLFGLNDTNKAVVGTFRNGLGKRIVGDGDLAPPADDGLSFYSFSRVWINEAGTIAFTGDARGANPNAGGRPGVWMDQGDGLSLLVLGEVEGDEIPFDLADGDLTAFVKLEQNGASGIYTKKGAEDKVLRVPVGEKVFVGQNAAFIADFYRMAINASGKLAFQTILVDGVNEFFGFPTLAGQLPGDGLLGGKEVLFSEQNFFGTPLAVNARGSVLVAVENIDSDDGFSLRLHRADGTIVPVLLDAEVIPGVAGGEIVLGFRNGQGMLDDEDGVLVLIATENGETLLRTAFEPDPTISAARRPVIAVSGPKRRVVRLASVLLRGTVGASSRPRVEVRLRSRPVRRAAVNAPGTRWVTGRLALRQGRNPVSVRAVDAEGLRSSIIRINVFRRK